MDSFTNSEVLGIEFHPQEALAVLLASSAVLALSGNPYQDDSLREAFIPNDLVNLVFGVPLLFASTIEKSLTPGALTYHIYTSLIYVLALREYPGWVFSLHLIIVCLSSAQLWKFTSGGKLFIRRKEEEEEGGKVLTEAVPSKYAGAILAFWGLLFAGRAFVRMELFEFFENLTQVESATDVTDMIIGVQWAVGGFALFRHANVALGLCLLFQASSLCFGLLLILLIRPNLFEELAFNLTDTMVVAAMWLTVTIPCRRFLAGSMKPHKHET
jgi:hypothetical protein